MGVVIVSVIVGILLTFNNLAFAKFGSKLCKSSEQQFICYKVKRGESWSKLFPDEDQRNIVMKINRTNGKLYKGKIIAIPKSLTSNLLDHAPFPLQINPPGTKMIQVSFKQLAFGAYAADGTLINWGPISAGRGFCPDINRRCHTPTGKFAIYSKGNSSCVSSKYPVGKGGAPMPYCMFFRGGYALHGSYDVPGYHASHGCIRMFVDDAKWLNTEFTAGEKTPVLITE